MSNLSHYLPRKINVYKDYSFTQDIVKLRTYTWAERAEKVVKLAAIPAAITATFLSPSLTDAPMIAMDAMSTMPTMGTMAAVFAMSKQVSSQSTASSDEHRWSTTPPQGDMWNAWFSGNDWALAFVAGFGSGKSEIMHYIAAMINSQLSWANIAVYAPTYDLLKLNNIPRISELLDHFGLSWTFNKADYIFTIKGHGKIICRSMDNPARIIAYEVFASLIDELDTMPKKRAEEAWNKIIARNRQQPPIGELLGTNTLIEDDDGIRFLKKPSLFDGSFSVVNKCGVFTTPEGFQFTYQKWEKEDNEGYRLVRAAT